GGGGGVRSSTAAAARGALTRLVMTWRTIRMRSPASVRARTSSPTRTGDDGLALSPLIRTWPARHAEAARERVRYTRTAHVQLSARALAPSGTSPSGGCGG